MIRVGLISDTHGLVRPEARAFLEGAQRILHAGDIGAASVLEELRALAPVTAVRGNNDTEAWASRIPERRSVRIGGVRIDLLHDRTLLRERSPSPTARPGEARPGAACPGLARPGLARPGLARPA